MSNKPKKVCDIKKANRYKDLLGLHLLSTVVIIFCLIQMEVKYSIENEPVGQSTDLLAFVWITAYFMFGFLFLTNKAYGYTHDYQTGLEVTPILQEDPRGNTFVFYKQTCSKCSRKRARSVKV